MGRGDRAKEFSVEKDALTLSDPMGRCRLFMIAVPQCFLRAVTVGWTGCGPHHRGAALSTNKPDFRVEF